MKSCVVRRRFWALEADNATVQVDTEPGFGTPKACIIQYAEVNAATDAVDTALAVRNMGISFIGPAGNGTTTLLLHTAWFSMQDNVATRAGRRQNSNSSAVYAHNQDGTTVFYRATGAGFGTDLMQLTFANQTPQSNGHIEAICTFIGGDDITVGVGTVPISTATSPATVSSLNFQPDLVFLTGSVSAINAGDNTDVRLSWGCATRSPLLNKSVGFHAEMGVGTADQGTLYSSNDAFIWLTNTTTGPFLHQVNTFTSTGFNIATVSTSTSHIYYMAIKGYSPTHFALRDISTPTATGDQFTGLGSTGFVPKTVIGGVVNTSGDATRTGGTTTPGADCIGLFAGNRSADSLYFNGTGTIQTNSAGTAVTGSGTSFYRLAPGFRLYQTNNTLIGTVSTVTSSTALTLTANAASTLAAGTSFVYSNQGQYCVSIGDQDGSSSNSTVFSRMAQRLIHTDSGTGTTYLRASLSDFDTRNGFNLNFTTVDASARKGWILAFKNTDDANEGRRRKQVGG